MITRSITTTERESLIDITETVSRSVRDAGAEDGICLVTCPHTTAGLTVNECVDPSVAEDLLAGLARCVPERAAWRHAEGNSPAHVKASLIGCSVAVPVHEGRLALGRWQGIFLCEFDGPRTRNVTVQIVS